jgi:hypothetical protein
MPQNVWQTAFASAARTASPTIVELTNPYGRAMIVVIDCTAVTATPSVVFHCDGYDPVSGKAYTLLDSAAITGTGTTVLRVGPGLTAAANLVANEPVPPRVKIEPVHADADSITYSVAVAFV